MRYRSCCIPRTIGTYANLYHGSTCLRQERYLYRAYCSHPNPQGQEPKGPSKLEAIRQHTLTTLTNLTQLGRQWGHTSMQTASATANYWWARYEEFVGLNEVRDAQTKVTEVGFRKVKWHWESSIVIETQHTTAHSAHNKIMPYLCNGTALQACVPMEAL